MFRNGVGHLALWMLGLEPQLCVGGCLFRAGPHEVRDTVGFCGPGNTGQIINGAFIGHVWLKLNGELIDFSCDEWRSAEQYELDNSADVFGPIQWQVKPPAMIWCYQSSLSRWQPRGSPKLGDVWYSGVLGGVPTNR